MAQLDVKLFKMLKKIGRLAYKFKVSSDWLIYSIFTVNHLETNVPPKNDLYDKPRPNNPSSIQIENNDVNNKSFELKKILKNSI